MTENFFLSESKQYVNILHSSQSHPSEQSIKQQTIDQIQRITTKKQLQLQELTSPSNKSNINQLISKTNTIENIIYNSNRKLKHQKVPTDVRFYIRNIKKFENLSTFIPSKDLLKANFSMPKLHGNHKDSIDPDDSEYADYLMTKQKKLREAQLTQLSIKKRKSMNHIYDDCWGQMDEEQHVDSEIPLNVGKELLQAHRLQLKYQDQLKQKQEEIRVRGEICNQKQIHNLIINESSNSRHILLKDEEKEEEIKEIKDQAKVYRDKSNMVIKLIQEAGKKIYNKKQDQVQKEMIMHKVERKMRQKRREEAKQHIEQILHHKPLYSTTNQRLITNKMESHKQFYPKKLSSHTKPPKSSYSVQSINEERKPRLLESKKQSTLNLKMKEIVNQIDTIDNLSPTEAFKQMQQEQLCYNTLRETLQSDKINETLKGLFLPNNIDYNRARRFKNKQFKNQLL